MSILSRADILTFLGKTTDITESEEGVLLMLQPMIEQAVKKLVGYSIEQATFTHYFPRLDRRSAMDPALIDYDASGGRTHVRSSAGSPRCGEIITAELPIRSITTIHEDSGAYAGQGATDFAASTLLTSGSDYWVDYDESGLCKTGIIRRIGAYWPSRPRTIQVVYVAGYTVAELASGIASPIKLACLATLQEIFASRGDAGGVLKSESLGDWSGTYAIPDGVGSLPVKARRLLRPFIHYGRGA